MQALYVGTTTGQAATFSKNTPPTGLNICGLHPGPLPGPGHLWQGEIVSLPAMATVVIACHELTYQLRCFLSSVQLACAETITRARVATSSILTARLAVLLVLPWTLTAQDESLILVPTSEYSYIRVRTTLVRQHHQLPGFAVENGHSHCRDPYCDARVRTQYVITIYHVQVLCSWTPFSPLLSFLLPWRRERGVLQYSSRKSSCTSTSVFGHGYAMLCYNFLNHLRRTTCTSQWAPPLAEALRYSSRV